MVRPLMQRILINLKESQSLAEQRDGLLPNLVSGRLRVNSTDEPNLDTTE